MNTQDCTCPLPHGGGPFTVWTYERYGGHYTPGPDAERAYLNARAHARHDGTRLNDIRRWFIVHKDNTLAPVVEVDGPLTLKAARAAGLAV